MPKVLEGWTETGGNRINESTGDWTRTQWDLKLDATAANSLSAKSAWKLNPREKDCYGDKLLLTDTQTRVRADFHTSDLLLNT